MANKKKETKASKKEENKKKKGKSEDSDEESFNLIDDDYEEDTFVEEVDEDEEEEEFKHFVEEHDKEYKDAKVVKVFDKIGKPKFKKTNELDSEKLKDEYKKLICLLDDKNIIIHFQNDYPVSEKYRFITEEVFNQDMEDLKKGNNHVKFIYEDFHPEMIEEDEDEETF